MVSQQEGPCPAAAVFQGAPNWCNPVGTLCFIPHYLSSFLQRGKRTTQPTMSHVGPVSFSAPESSLAVICRIYSLNHHTQPPTYAHTHAQIHKHAFPSPHLQPSLQTRKVKRIEERGLCLLCMDSLPSQAYEEIEEVEKETRKVKEVSHSCSTSKMFFLNLRSATLGRL